MELPLIEMLTGMFSKNNPAPEKEPVELVWFILLSFIDVSFTYRYRS